MRTWKTREGAEKAKKEEGSRKVESGVFEEKVKEKETRRTESRCWWRFSSRNRIDLSP